MKLAFEIVAIWTALNFIVGIPVWMLVKLRDRREMFEKGIDWEDSYASEQHSNLASSAVPKSGRPGSSSPIESRPNRSVPLVVGAGRLVPGPGSAMPSAVQRAGTDYRSVTDV